MKPALKRFLKLWLGWGAFDLARRASFFLMFGGISAAVSFLDLLDALGINPFFLFILTVFSAAVMGGVLGHCQRKLS
ncbi:MAG: hypothetical protein J3T61_12765 [Candidatus Brocadiales bacterium]|nr:hypothetical protein [Candidatus Bathyanammoxibius sp.]